GDPALLLPKLYMPNSELRKYKIGIIPHYVDKNNDFFNRAVPDWIKVIDIENPNYKDFVDDLIGCEVVISSSLHGLIIADAYGIPSVWARFSNMIYGGDFKFHDYFLSVGREVNSPVIMSSDIQYNKLLDLKYFCSKKIDISS